MKNNGQSSVLIILGPGAPLEPIHRLFKARGTRVYLSRSFAEASRLYMKHLDQIEYVFVETTLCASEDWVDFAREAQVRSPDVVFVFFNPAMPESLSGLLKLDPKAQDDPNPEEAPGPFIVGKNQLFLEALDLARRYAVHETTVLITGETGTGKEVIAKYIHNYSARRHGPFVAYNLASIPETLVESELFGYVRGAFTGADRDKKGLVEAAKGGTLLLDEIGDFPIHLQVKLLRLLENKEYYRIGESSARTADVRLIAATNRDLERSMREDNFRTDLFYRLSSGRVMIPALRERGDDIIPLAEHFTQQSCQRFGKPPKRMDNVFTGLLRDYSWPGNVRELKHVMENAVLLADNDVLSLDDLPMHLQHYTARRAAEPARQKVPRTIDDAERDLIDRTLEETGGHKDEAAKRLGISTRTLYRKIRQ